MLADAVLFDVDGTLVDTRVLYLEAYRRALVDVVGRPLSDEELMAAAPRSETRVLALFAPRDKHAEIVRRFHDEYRDLHGTLCGGLYDGVPAMLDALRQRSIPLGVVTGKSKRAWEVTCAAFELGRFDVHVFDDDVRAPKPDPHGLLLAAEALGMAPGRVAYVGDSATDMVAARSAGMLPVAAMWSKTPANRERLLQGMEATNALVIERPLELVSILEL